MEEGFQEFAQSKVSESFTALSADLVELDVENSSDATLGDETIAIVIGMVNSDESLRGRITLTCDSAVVQAVTHRMLGDEPADTMETYFTIAEFVNMFCGGALTEINNRYKGTGLRLTPPAIFAGKGMEITAPSVASQCSGFRSSEGSLTLDVGFEG
ncbi:MAG: chemotaxis protein CheX [Synergistales bacterium]|nr:chemotaxis protein CheX [Synergistales bacterium]